MRLGNKHVYSQIRSLKQLKKSVNIARVYVCIPQGPFATSVSFVAFDWANAHLKHLSHLSKGGGGGGGHDDRHHHHTQQQEAKQQGGAGAAEAEDDDDD